MTCRICNSETTQFLQLNQQPLANKYPTKDQLNNEKFYPLNIDFCENCKTVQLDIVIDRSELFTDYYYLSSVNKGLTQHFDSLAKQIKDMNPSFVVDIGSNDGVLLKPLKEYNVKALGIEPSKNVSKIAQDNNLDTLNAFFDEHSTRLIIDNYGKPDVIIASSVFTHLENPHLFIDNVRNLLADDGMFIIEIEYIENIINELQFERFYFDRIFLYSLTSLMHLMSQHGMKVIDVLPIETHGGSIRVMAVKQSRNWTETQTITDMLKKEDELNLLELQKFAANSSLAVQYFKRSLINMKITGAKVAGYGVPARVSTILNYGQIDKSLIPFIIDDSPLKVDKYTPGTHIPIKSLEYLKEHPVDILVVFAYEYLSDIKEKTKGYAKQYFRPIPMKELK